MKHSQKFSCQKRVFLGLILWLQLEVSENQQHASLGHLLRTLGFQYYCFFPYTGHLQVFF